MNRCRVRNEKHQEEQASRVEAERKIKSVINLRDAIDRNKVGIPIVWSRLLVAACGFRRTP